MVAGCYRFAPGWLLLYIGAREFTKDATVASDHTGIELLVTRQRVSFKGHPQ